MPPLPSRFLRFFVLLFCLFASSLVVESARAEGSPASVPGASAPAPAPAPAVPAPSGENPAPPPPAARRPEDEDSAPSESPGAANARATLSLFHRGMASLGFRTDPGLVAENTTLRGERDRLTGELSAARSSLSLAQAAAQEWETTARQMQSEFDALVAALPGTAAAAANPAAARTPAGQRAAAAVEGRVDVRVAAELRSMSQPASQLPGTGPAASKRPVITDKKRADCAAYWSGKGGAYAESLASDN